MNAALSGPRLRRSLAMAFATTLSTVTSPVQTVAGSSSRVTTSPAPPRRSLMISVEAEEAFRSVFDAGADLLRREDRAHRACGLARAARRPRLACGGSAGAAAVAQLQHAFTAAVPCP